MKNKDVRKLRKRIKRLETKLDFMLAQEKRLVDLVVRLTTEHVSRELERRERQLVDSVVRHTTEELKRDRPDPGRLAEEIARRLKPRESTS